MPLSTSSAVTRFLGCANFMTSSQPCTSGRVPEVTIDHGTRFSSSRSNKAREPGISTASCPNSFGIKPSTWLTSYLSDDCFCQNKDIVLTLHICELWLVDFKDIDRPSSMRCGEDYIRIDAYLFSNPMRMCKPLDVKNLRHDLLVPVLDYCIR